MENKVCAITSYFNPLQSERRYKNYKLFAKNLDLFLITVELSREEACFDLTKDDADIYVRVVNPTILWHKESLLNIALRHVPEHIEYIVWIDCDVIFKNKNWKNDLCKSLEEFKLVQLFSILYDLREENTVEDMKNSRPSGYSIAYLNKKK